MGIEKLQPLKKRGEEINDPKIEEEMAYAEKPYRENDFSGVKKFFYSVKTGEKLAEEIGDILHNLDSPEIQREKTYSDAGFLHKEVMEFHVNEDKVNIVIYRTRSNIGIIEFQAHILINDEEIDEKNSNALKKVFAPLIQNEINSLEIEDKKSLTKEKGEYEKKKMKILSSSKEKKLGNDSTIANIQEKLK